MNTVNARSTHQEQTAGWVDIEDFREGVAAWADKLRVTPTRIRLQTMTRKWVSCSTNGALIFNRELLAKPRPFGEAVILHEIIHLTVRNHGRLFRSLLRAHMPEAELLLQHNGIES